MHSKIQLHCPAATNSALSAWTAGVQSMELNLRRTKWIESAPYAEKKIPPSREIVAQLKFWQWQKSEYEAKDGNIFSQSYMNVKSRVEKLEHEIGDWTETIDYSVDDKSCLVLPKDIYEAAIENNIQKVLERLGPLPVDKQRLNARNPEMLDVTLVYCAVCSENSDLLRILLQLGADVDPIDVNGFTPLGIELHSESENTSQARLLLEWGGRDF